MPLVRIVIPTYNRANLLAEALETVIAQSFTDFEAVVVDDGSVDNTQDILKKFVTRDSRIRFLRQENCGVAKAKNRAISEPGNYRYVAFLDSDDLWHPQHLENSVEVLMRQPEVALVFSRIESINIGGHLTQEIAQARDSRMNKLLRRGSLSTIAGVYLLDPGTCFHALLRSEFAVHPSTTVIRREAVSRSEWFNPSLVILEDVELFLHIASRDRFFAFADSIQSQVRYHGDNLTGSKDLSSPVTLQRYLSVLDYYKLKLRFCTEREDIRFVSEEIAGAAYLLAQCYAEQSDLPSARRLYFEALRQRITYDYLKGLVFSFLPSRVYLFLKKLRDTHRNNTNSQTKPNC